MSEILGSRLESLGEEIDVGFAKLCPLLDTVHSAGRNTRMARKFGLGQIQSFAQFPDSIPQVVSQSEFDMFER